MVKIIRRIIVEGPDRSGKSTLVKALKDILGWDSKYLGHKNVKDQYQRYLKEYALNEDVVFDRSHISEIVYSKLWDRPLISEDDVKSLDYIASKNGLIIFSLPPLEVVLERHNNTRGTKISDDDLVKSYELFRKIKNKYWAQVYTETTFEGLEKFVENIRDVVYNNGLR